MTVEKMPDGRWVARFNDPIGNTVEHDLGGEVATDQEATAALLLAIEMFVDVAPRG
jgi:hypothetical protein